MRLFLCLFLNLLYLSFFAQNSKYSAVIEYKIFNNTDSPNTLYANVFVNNQVTIWIPKYSTQVFNNTKEEAKRSNRVIIDEDYLKIDHKQKEIFSFEDLGFNKVIVKDDYNLLKWNVTGETKNIAGYQCVKAAASYRGVDWIVWFAPEILLPYGPWKLHGLPGLIIEAYDSTGTYTWRAEKIEYKKDDIFEKQFNTLVKTSNKKPLSKKQYIEDQEEFEANADAKFRLTIPGLQETVIVTRGGYELKYEWEK